MQKAFPSHLRNRITDSICWHFYIFIRNLWQIKLRFSMRYAAAWIMNLAVDFALKLRWKIGTSLKQFFMFFVFKPNNFSHFSFQFKIQFDDSLTATFEYPSETSLMIDEWLNETDEVDANFYGRSNTATSPSKLMNSVPLGKGPSASRSRAHPLRCI